MNNDNEAKLLLCQPNVKEDMIDSIESAVRKRIGVKRTTNSLRRSCLWYALESLIVLRKHGLNAVPQAGSASWLIVPPELDDGVSPTHYSYIFELEQIGITDLLEIFSTERMPEIHVWAALPETNEVIDLTTKYIPVLAKTAGHECKVAQPDYIWGDVRELTKKGIYYQPSEVATRLAWSLMQQSLSGCSVIAVNPPIKERNRGTV